MGRATGTIRAAAVQLSPVISDRDGTTEKVVRAIERCGRTALGLATLIAVQFLLPGCEVRPKWEDFQEGVHLVLEVESTGDPTTDNRNVLETTRILEKRITGSGIREKIIQSQGGRQIVVQLPIHDERLIDILSTQTFLEFKLVLDVAPDENLLRAQSPEGLGEGKEIAVAFGDDGSIASAYLVAQTPILTGAMLEDARLGYDRRNRPVVFFRWNSEGTAIFREFTTNNVDRQLAIMIDKQVITAPVIQSTIGRDGQIEGQFTKQEAADLAVALRSGALPVPVRVIESERLTRDLWLGNVEQ
jgi:preprotein translocase subunit SecD